MRIGLTIPHRLHGAAIYGAPWIPSTKTPFMLAYIYIYTSTMDPSWVLSIQHNTHFQWPFSNRNMGESCRPTHPNLPQLSKHPSVRGLQPECSWNRYLGDEKASIGHIGHQQTELNRQPSDSCGSKRWWNLRRWWSEKSRSLRWDSGALQLGSWYSNDHIHTHIYIYIILSKMGLA